MQYSSIGDLSQSLQLRRYNAELSAELTRLSEEVTTGVTSDVGKTVGGDYRPLAGIESSLKAVETHQKIANEAAQFSSGMQSRLEHVQTQAEDISASLLSDAYTADPDTADIVARSARDAFHSTVSSLNGRDANGASYFAGTASDSDALASADVMLDELKLAVAGETTAAGVAAVVSDWFNAPGGGFETMGYLGSDDPPSDFRLSPDQTAGVEVTATDPAIRTVLEGLALAALVAEDIPAGDNAAQREMLDASRDLLLTGSDQVVTLRADVGYFEGAVADAETRNEAEKNALELARLEIIGVDSYEAAAQLEAVQTQLETLYSVTARLSQLTLADYLR